MPKVQLYFGNDDDNVSYLNRNCNFHEKCIWHWLTRTSKFLEGAEKLLLKLLIYWKFISFSGTQTSQQTTTNTTNNNVNDRNNNQEVTTPLIWQEFTVPPIWKRLVAEIIDFFFLFLLKLLVTFAAVDMLSIIDLERYDDDFMNFFREITICSFFFLSFSDTTCHFLQLWQPAALML